MSETRDIDELNPNLQNPRKISDQDFNALRKSMEHFGDLSGIVFNIRTKKLVGGHQRTEKFRASDIESKVLVTTRFPQANKVGTVALGYVQYDGENYAYREVDWDEATEKAANIAANRISGEWDMELLAEWDQWLLENNPDLLELTGQRDDEINKLLGNETPSDAEEDSGLQKLRVELTDHQYEIVQHGIAVIRTKRKFSESVNRDLEGNALAAIVEEWLSVNDVDTPAA